MHHVGCMTVLNLTWFRAFPPPEGEGNRYLPPPSRGRSGGGWGFVGAGQYVFSVMDSSVTIAGSDAHLPMQHFLYFRPLPHGHGSLRPVLGVAWATLACSTGTCLSRDCWRHRADSSATKGWQWVKKRLKPAHR